MARAGPSRLRAISPLRTTGAPPFKTRTSATQPLPRASSRAWEQRGITERTRQSTRAPPRHQAASRLTSGRMSPSWRPTTREERASRSGARSTSEPQQPTSLPTPSRVNCYSSLRWVDQRPRKARESHQACEMNTVLATSGRLSLQAHGQGSSSPLVRRAGSLRAAPAPPRRALTN